MALRKEVRQSKEWKEKSLRIRKEVGRCQWPFCEETDVKKLQVHHLSVPDKITFLDNAFLHGKEEAMKRLASEYFEEENLVVMCKRHHYATHCNMKPCANCGKIIKGHYKYCLECVAEKMDWPKCIVCGKYIKHTTYDVFGGKCWNCYDEMIDYWASKQ